MALRLYLTMHHLGILEVLVSTTAYWNSETGSCGMYDAFCCIKMFKDFDKYFSIRQGVNIANMVAMLGAWTHGFSNTQCVV